MLDRPQTIGRFRVLGLLGRGAMGVVYKAHDPEIDRVVVIKLIRADLLDGESRVHYLDRFRNEARRAGRCIHPNIVGIHDLSSHEGNPFLVLEFVEGRDLARARAAVGEVDAAVAVMRKVLAALHYAHGFGVIHRDIKPANIMLAGDQVKVTDFGISRALSAEATMSSVLVGTPCYMSPEQCLGQAVDERSDLFSVGSVLYELLSGQRAFAAANFVATMHRVMHEHPQPLATLRAGLPAALVAVVDRALAKRPADRYATAAEMEAALAAAALAPLIGGGPVPAPAPAAADEDGTVIRLDAAVRAPEAASSLSRTSSSTLQAIERQLAHHVGPVARRFLQRAMLDATSPDDLCQRLSQTLPPGADRDQFARLARETLRRDEAIANAPAGGATAPGGLDKAAVARLLQGPTEVLGPIAPRLLSRMLADVEDLDALQARCLDHIGRADERERFKRFVSS